MAFHHLALATTDLPATHRFYTEAMGFSLVHVEDGATDAADGWFHHALYDTGDGTLMAFMEVHDERCVDFDAAISRGLGLPSWVNHIAFGVDDLDALDAARDRWLGCGHDVVQMQHSHGTSIYTEDPNGNTIEWACDTRAFSHEERVAASTRLVADDLPRDAPTDMEFFLADSAGGLPQRAGLA
jgi:catechol 2,3-dioxygenase-like lactoylglutathione lyase family enzyme